MLQVKMDYPELEGLLPEVTNEHKGLMSSSMYALIPKEYNKSKYIFELTGAISPWNRYYILAVGNISSQYFFVFSWYYSVYDDINSIAKHSLNFIVGEQNKSMIKIYKKDNKFYLATKASDNSPNFIILSNYSAAKQTELSIDNTFEDVTP